MSVSWVGWIVVLLVSLNSLRANVHLPHDGDNAPILRFPNESDKQILDVLLNSSRYDKRDRPNVTTFVNVSVLLLTLSSPDESSLKYEVEFLMHQQWTDPRLRFNDSGRHRYLNGFTHADLIWLPDTYFIKHGEFKSPLLPIHLALRIYRNGTVQYSMRRHMALNCQGNLKIFPFDNPKCPFAIEIISHEDNEVKLDWSRTTPEISRASNIRYHNAYLVKNTTGVCDEAHTWRGNYSCLRVLLVFTRDKSFYFSTVFVPGMVLVTSSFISFWLDINAVPARVMIGVTTMLNFCTTTNSFRSTLPVVSNLTAMNLWDGVCMFFIYASMLEFICVNYLFRKWPHGPGGTRPPSAAANKQEQIIIDPSPALPASRCQSALSQAAPRKSASDNNSQDLPSATTPPEFPPSENNQVNHRLNTGKARAAASVFAWLRRPQMTYVESPERSRIPRAVDNVSKLVFPLLFGGFTFGYFLTYAVIKPGQDENWKLSGYASTIL